MLISTLTAQTQLPAPTGLEVAADVAMIVIAVAVLILVILSAALILKLNRSVSEMRLGVRQNLGPVSDRARSISDNVEFITQTLRSDVDRLTDSVQSLTDRLHQASDHMEERIEEFNALMEVVQGEAEEIFLDTASTVRGVREGARAISRPRRANAVAEDDADGHEEEDEAPDERSERPPGAGPHGAGDERVGVSEED